MWTFISNHGYSVIQIRIFEYIYSIDKNLENDTLSLGCCELSENEDPPQATTRGK